MPFPTFPPAFSICLAALALLVGGLAGAPLFGQEMLDGRKSQHLFSLAKFVQWPDDKFPTPSTPLRVGFVGSGGVRDLFEEANKSLRVAQRPFVTASVHSNADVRECHMLFLQPTVAGSYSALLSEARRRHVLTVGHSDDFIREGGMINFVRSGNTVRIQINERMARRAGIRIDSRLLSAAEIVDDNGSPVMRFRNPSRQP